MSTPTNSEDWYVCFTKPRQEAFALGQLQAQGYEGYLPEITRWVRGGRAWKRSASAMFPRYLFVRPASAAQSISPIRSTAGVSTLVKFGHHLATLPETHLQALRGVLDELRLAMPNQPFTPGMSVAFAEGPLKGLEGIVSTIAEERVTVLFTLMGQPQRVAVSPNQLAVA